jgi:hypothetical protein
MGDLGLGSICLSWSNGDCQQSLVDALQEEQQGMFRVHRRAGRSGRYSIVRSKTFAQLGSRSACVSLSHHLCFTFIDII